MVDSVMSSLAAAYGIWVVLASLIAAVLIWQDKRAALRGAWRVSERTLHLWELLGGFPGAYLMRHMVRHKTRKRSYRLTAAVCTASHLLVLTAVIWLLAR